MPIVECPTAIRVAGVPGGGPSPDGKLIVTELALHSGEVISIQCDAETAERLIVGLQTFAAMAKQIRDGANPESLEVGDVYGDEPYEATQLRFFFQDEGRKIILQASGSSGPPRNIALDAAGLDQLQATCKQAARQAARLHKGRGSRGVARAKSFGRTNIAIESHLPHLSRLVEMPVGQTSNDGRDILFNFVSDDGSRYAFIASYDAIDIILANLEELARKALAKRLEGLNDRQMPNPAVPPMLTHSTSFIVEESEPTDSFVGLRLVIHRGSRSPIHIPLGRESFLQFVEALRNWDAGSDSKLTH